MTVCLAVNHQTASAADTFATVMIELDWYLSVLDEVLIDDVQQFEKRHVFANVFGFVGLEMTGVVGAVLPPNLKREVELFAHL